MKKFICISFESTFTQQERQMATVEMGIKVPTSVEDLKESALLRY